MTNTIRVLHICGSITTSGGIGTFLINNYKNIDREKVQFDFLSHNETEQQLVEEITRMGGHVYRITPKSKNILKNIIETIRMINRKSAHQIIHVHTASTTSFLYLLIAKFAEKKIRIIHSHGTNLEKPKGSFQHKIHNIFQPLLLSYATDLFACSKAAGKWLYGEENVDRLKVINNAVYADKLKFNMKIRTEARNKLNISNKFVIGHVGRFAEVKNHLFLLDIFKEISSKKNDAVLILIGGGELEDLVKDKVKEWNLTDSVMFMGVRSDIPELLQAMDVFVFPSLYEGLPVTLIEAQAAGLKVIASDTITEEIKLTDLVEFISLEKPASYWADQILSYADGYERKNTYNEICKAGYNVKDSAKWLEKFYLNQNHQ